MEVKNAEGDDRMKIEKYKEIINNIPCSFEKTILTVDELKDLIRKYGLDCKICEKGKAKYVSEGSFISSGKDKKHSEGYSIVLKCQKCGGLTSVIFEEKSIRIGRSQDL